MESALRADLVRSVVGKTVMVVLEHRPQNPPEHYVLEGKVVDASYQVYGESDLTTELWLTEGSYTRLDVETAEPAVFRPGHREQITLTDEEFDRVLASAKE